MYVKTPAIRSSIASLSLAVAGCGGFISNPSGTIFNINGVVSAGPVQGATVNVYSLNANGSQQSLLGTATTDSSGKYNLSIPAPGGPVVFVASGGSYTEEGSHAAVNLGAAEIRTVLDSIGDKQQVGITPVTEISTQAALAAISSNVGVGLASVIKNTNSTVAVAMGLSDITKPPADPTLPASQASGTAAAQYAVLLASLSQLANSASTANSTTINSLDLMQALATSFTYNGSFNSLIGAVNVLVPNAAGSTITLTSVLGGSSSFNTAMQNATQSYLNVPSVSSLGYADSTLAPQLNYATSPSTPANVPSITLPAAPSQLFSSRPIAAGLPPFVEAAHTALPQAVNNGGTVLSHPKILPIYYPADPWSPSFNQFFSRFATSSELSAMVSEYGGGTATVLPSVTLSETAPYTIDNSAIQPWLSQVLNTSNVLGAPDDQTIYEIFYPASTVVTYGTDVSCQAFGGYHDAYLDATSGLNIHYAVIPRCNDYSLNDTTGAVSHETVETITDPNPNNGVPGINGVDANSLVWEALTGLEIADLCEMFSNSFYVASDIGYEIQRTWSNAAAAAGNNPCVPAQAGSVYFNAAPVLPDTVTLSGESTKGVNIPIGQSKTIEIQLFSNRPTSDNWTVSAQDLSWSGQQYLSFSWDSTTGSNGTVLHLTITANAADPDFQTGAPFWIVSQLGNGEYMWPVYVGN